MVDDFGQDSSALQEFGWVELALEDAVLEVVAKVFHGAMDFFESLVIANVVGNEVGVSHNVPLVGTLGRMCFARQYWQVGKVELPVA